MEDRIWKIVLLGKSGAGRSSLANTIFGQEDDFDVTHSSTSATKSYQTKTKTINGRILQLTKAPGLQDTDSDNAELLTCIEEFAPGSHAFLIVLKVEAFTVQEQAVVALILKYLSEEALKFTTVVFTHGDQLPEGTKIEDWARENNHLSSLVDKCGGRCHVFDNKYWNDSQDPYRNNQFQITELLNSIEETLKGNQGRVYTKEMLNSAPEIRESCCRMNLQSLLCCCFGYNKIS